MKASLVSEDRWDPQQTVISGLIWAQQGLREDVEFSTTFIHVISPHCYLLQNSVNICPRLMQGQTDCCSYTWSLSNFLFSILEFKGIKAATQRKSLYLPPHAPSHTPRVFLTPSEPACRRRCGCGEAVRAPAQADKRGQRHQHDWSTSCTQLTS